MKQFERSEKILISLIAFFTVKLAMLLIFGWNQSQFYDINSVSQYTGDWIWANLTIFGDAMIVCALFFPFIRKKPEMIFHLVIAALITTLFVQILKSVTHIDRPARALDPETFHIIGRKLTRRAFPSGHTATIFTGVSVVVFYVRRAWMKAGLILFAFIVGAARIVVGAHWPADVAGGAVFGLLGGLIGYYLIQKWKWGVTRTAMIVWGALLLITVAVLLIDYNTHYHQSDWLKYSLGGICFVGGGYEYIQLIRKKGTSS